MQLRYLLGTTALSCLFILLCFQSSLAQNLIFEKEIAAAGVSKEALYNRAVTWLNNRYSSYEGSIEIMQISEQEGEVIKLKGRKVFDSQDSHLGTLTDGHVLYELVITVSKGSWSFRYDNFIHVPKNLKYSFGYITVDAECPTKVSNTTTKSKLAVWQELKQVSTTGIESDIKKLETAMATKLQSSGKAIMYHWVRDGFYSSYNKFKARETKPVGYMRGIYGGGGYSKATVTYVNSKGEEVAYKVTGATDWGCRSEGEDYVFYKGKAMRVIVSGLISMYGVSVSLSRDEKGNVTSMYYTPSVSALFVQKGPNGKFLKVKNKSPLKDLIADDSELSAKFKDIPGYPPSGVISQYIGFINTYNERHPEK